MSESSNFTDYYELLGIPTDAQPQTIRSAYIRLAKQYHPDRGGSTEEMQRLTNAYRTLAAPSRRRAYDLQHSFYADGLSRYLNDSVNQGNAINGNLDDEDIDAFLDNIYAEYRSQTAVNKSPFARFKQWLTESL